MVKGEDDNDVFHSVARADSVIEEKNEKEEEGEDRDSCKSKVDDGSISSDWWLGGKFSSDD